MYNDEKVDLARVVTPPYDVISRSMQNRFYNADPHNVIRLILGRKEKKDTPHSNKYTRAALTLNHWIRDGILIEDPRPAIYVYTQEYLHKGRKRRRIGFIALMRIEDPKESGILPHEYTLDKPKADRANLILKTKANLSPIFCLFRDKENVINIALKSFIKSKTALFEVDVEGVTHRFWRSDEKKIIEMIRNRMRGKKVFIADGHHRYEVALAYRNKMRKLKGYKKSVDYVMMYFSNLSESGNLTILSTHRVVRNIPGFCVKKITIALKKYFFVEHVGSVDDLFTRLEKIPRNKHSFGAYFGRKLYQLRLKEKYFDANFMDPKKKSALGRLDVTILHDLVINEILGVKNAESSIKYVRDENDAVSLVRKGDYEAVFFLKPTQVSEMAAVAQKGEMMPQKSTYF